MMIPSADCVELISKFEGLRLTAYADSAGVWTIGYGHTKGVQPGDTITPRVALDFLSQDCSIAANEVARHLPGVTLLQREFDALCSLVFNLGPKPLRLTLGRLLRTGDKIGAAKQFGLWVNARNPKTGKLEPLLGLKRRRAAERAMFEGREWRAAAAAVK